MTKRICGNSYYAPFRAMGLEGIPGDRVETLPLVLYSLQEYATLWLICFYLLLFIISVK
jgi:hypothetical protein